MDHHTLSQIVIIFGISVAVLFGCALLKIPNVVGLLIAGVLVGPDVLGITKDSKEINALSEIGVVMLLFTIGMEFSLKELGRIRNQVLLGGSLQVFLTLGATALAGKVLGLPWNEAVFLGFLLSLSSTAIVLNILQARDEVNSPQGRLSLAVLIFQDIIVVPMMLLVPMLAGKSQDMTYDLLMLGVKGVGIILMTLLIAQYVMPWVLYQITRLRSQEIFLLSVIVICFGVAWLTGSLGLSLSLGAFLAGLIISESEYSHQALSIVMPFRDLFTSFFFISIGMLMDLNYVIAHPISVAAATLGVLGLKFIVMALAAFLMGFPLRTILLVGFALCQVGEFAFVLSISGKAEGVLSEDNYQLFLAMSVLSMAASPFIILLSYRLTNNLGGKFIPGMLRHGWRKSPQTENEQEAHVLNDHLIIVGFGVSGQNIAYAAKTAGIPYVVLEMNPTTVRREKAKGEHIHYGDATQESMLNHMNLKRARVLVVAIPDPVATRAIVSLSRRMAPGAYIIVRTHYMKEMQMLFDLGADEVIPEEFETSIEIFSIVLTKYLIPQNEIDSFIESVRANGYRMFRSPVQHSLSIADIQQSLSGINISTFVVNKDAEILDKTLEDLSLRQQYGVNLLAIVHDEEVISNPDADTIIRAGDKIIVSGRAEEIFAFSEVAFGKRKAGRRLKL